MIFGEYLLRPLLQEDLDAYFSMVERNRTRLEDFFTGTVSRTRTLEDTRQFLADITAKREAKTYYPYLLVEKGSGTIAGFFDLKNIDWSVPKAEVGCYMDVVTAGKGIASGAFEIFCKHCFDELGFEKLFLRTHENNTAARKLAEKTGFIQEGILRKDYKTTAGELVDLLYYGRLK